VVDSTMTSGATGVDSKIWESLTHYHRVNAWLPKNMLVVNRKEFDKLDKATQATVVRSAADMKGLKWRAYNPATSKIAQSVGAQPMTIQAAELSQALATGVVDSTMTSGATGVDSKIWESLTHYHRVNAWLPKNMLVVNRKEFDKLDKATQATVVRLAAEAEKKGWDRMRAYDDESVATLAKNKMTIVTPAPQLMADMKKIGDELVADWLKQSGAEGKEILDAYARSAKAPAKK
jgi:TRAP-type transport system periplasmic protein